MISKLRIDNAGMPFSHAKSILIFDFHLIGDIVLLIPFLSAVRRGYPDAKITLVAGPWASEVLKGSMLIDEIKIFQAPWVKKIGFISGLFACCRLINELSKFKWDLGIEIRGDARQILLLWIIGPNRRVGFNFTGGRQLLTDIVPDDGRLRHLGLHHLNMANYLNIWKYQDEYSPSISLNVSELKEAAQIPGFIGFHFGASLPLRRFPENEISNLLSKFSGSNKYLIIFLPPGDNKKLINLIDNFPESLRKNVIFWSGNLRKMIILISRAEHMYVMDSGPAHISAALNIPTTVFYGPANYEYVFPIGRDVRIISNDNLACRPCNQKKCTNDVYQLCFKGLADKISV